MSRTTNSTTIPQVLLAAVAQLRLGRAGRTQATPPPPKPAQPRRALASAHRPVTLLPASAISTRKLVAHGAGVFEDPETNAIWFRVGDTLHRRDLDVERLIHDYVTAAQ